MKIDFVIGISLYQLIEIENQSQPLGIEVHFICELL